MNYPAIPKDAEICRVLTCLHQKFIVDFANGIDVARDHQRVQRERSGFYARLRDGLSGKGARRQAEINAPLIDGVEASLHWLTELTESLAHSHLAIARVNERVNSIKQEMATLANYSFETRQGLQEVAQRLNNRCDKIEKEVARIDFVQRVQRNLSAVFARWEGGRFESLSPAGRCFAALEELRWGDFGDYCRIHTGQERQQFLQEATNRAIAQLKRDLQSTASERFGATLWLKPPAGESTLPNAAEALAYLAEEYPPQQNPFVFVSAHAVEQLPLHVPRIMSATRLSETLVEEVFTRDIYA